ncbi:MAG TPA: hypothetical protein VJA23_00395 [Candidatus Nanoarchaeia archaeon]|nr:hypothetical protein [Candidatus Nanoarchaeia archaeon]
MASYNPAQQVLELRQQGLSDEMIAEELRRSGISGQEISSALGQSMGDYPPDDASFGMEEPAYAPKRSGGGAGMSSEEGNIYERIEAITESMIDEKWEELIGEVKKIVEWKNKIEEKQTRIQNDLDKLKDDFKVLHQGVLGKLDDYDSRMKEVGVELKAVGKVFKDVIPEFVDNVKELKGITKGFKGE